MKRISDCVNNVLRTPGKQYILSSDMSNRQSFEESMIMDNDQDYDYITKVINDEKRCSISEKQSKSHLITSTNQTWISLSQYFENYGEFPLPEWMSALIISDVAKALCQLHTNQLSHDAIGAENVHFMTDSPDVCLMFNRSHLRKMKPDEILQSRSDNIHQLGWVLHRCLTGKTPKFQTNGDLAEPSGPFNINADGLRLCRKMLARKFHESAHFVEMHSFIQTALDTKTPRFLNLF